MCGMNWWPIGRDLDSAFWDCWFDLLWWRSRYALLVGPKQLFSVPYVACGSLLDILVMVIIYIYIYIYVCVDRIRELLASTDVCFVSVFTFNECLYFCMYVFTCVLHVSVSFLWVCLCVLYICFAYASVFRIWVYILRMWECFPWLVEFFIHKIMFCMSI